MNTIKVSKKGGPGSGYHGHAGRPGLEGGAIPKGGSRRVYGTGERTRSFPKGKKIPPVPKLSQSSSGKIPPHVKGDSNGSKAYRQWKSSAGAVSEADDSKMKSWFTDRAKAMEFNASIPTVVPGQRDEEEEDKKKEPKEKEPEKKEPVKKKTGKAKKVAKKKEPKGKAPAKPKKVKVVKKKGPTDEERAKILKAVGIKPDMYLALREAEKVLKAGDTLNPKLMIKLQRAGLLKIIFIPGVDQATLQRVVEGLKVPEDMYKLRLESFGQSIIKAVERGDAIAAQRIMDKLEAKKKKAAEVKPKK